MNLIRKLHHHLFQIIYPYFIGIALSLILSFSACAEDGRIYSASSVAEINNTLMELLEKRNPEKTLVLMPLEGFLIKPNDPIFQVRDPSFNVLMGRVFKRAKLSKQAFLEELILTEYEHSLSNPLLVDFFQNLQEKNAPYIVVTKNFSGSINKIPYLEVWTWSYLYDLGIDLSKSPIGSHQILFNKRHKKLKGTYPTYFKGLLSCNSWDRKNSPQGVLANLLAAKLKNIPDVIYVIHKEESYIKSLEQQFKSLRQDVQVVGFVYSKDEERPHEVSANEFKKFWGEVIDKLNKVKRTESDKNKVDPYEQ